MTDLSCRKASGSVFGWLPDRPNKQDYPYQTHLQTLAKKPTIDDVLLEVPKFNEKVAVRDQGQLGSCVANSSDELFDYIRDVAPRSRLQIYYEARRLIGTTDEDSGCYNRDAMKVLSTLGAGRESWWTYDDGPTKFKEDPIAKVDRDGLKRKIFDYFRLDTHEDFARCLAEGFPFMIGATLYTRFVGADVAKHGIVSMPVLSQESEEGGHSFTVWGRHLAFRSHPWAKWAMAHGLRQDLVPDQVYLCRNHWSGDWGLPMAAGVGAWGGKSNFVMPCAYLDDRDLADDPWTFRKPTSVAHA
jgi:hypothetical protein